MNKIVAAAVKDNTGTLHVLAPPARHHDILRVMSNTGYGEQVYTCEQGFITDTGEFLLRAPALAVALASGQVIESQRTVPGLPELFSEDLW